MKNRGFMLIEVLIALALFALTAVYLVEGAFIGSRTMLQMKASQEFDHDLLWARSEIFRETNYEKLKEGGELETVNIGEVVWEVEVEMTDIVDLYRVLLNLSWDGNSELEIDAGERDFVMLLLRPVWMNHPDFKTDRQALLERKSDKIKALREESKMGNIDNIRKVKKSL
jgi:prepilin-type N-terminal cleavage/methylation domain-containing protein